MACKSRAGGYSSEAIARNPQLTALRADPRYGSTARQPLTTSDTGEESMPNPNVDRAPRQAEEESRRRRRRSRASRMSEARLQLHRIPRPARGLVAAEGEGPGTQRQEEEASGVERLREDWWNVGNQGDTGSCVGWAFADSVLRYHFVKAGKLRKHEHISVRYIWMAAKEMDHRCRYPTTFLDDAGTSAKAALKVVTKFGALKTSVLPFEGGLVKLKESHFLKVAGRLKVRAYFNLCAPSRASSIASRNGWPFTGRS